MPGKRRRFDKNAHVKAMARKAVGPPPPSRTLDEKKYSLKTQAQETNSDRGRLRIRPPQSLHTSNGKRCYEFTWIYPLQAVR